MFGPNQHSDTFLDLSLQTTKKSQAADRRLSSNFNLAKLCPGEGDSLANLEIACGLVKFLFKRLLMLIIKFGSHKKRIDDKINVHWAMTMIFWDRVTIYISNFISNDVSLIVWLIILYKV